MENNEGVGIGLILALIKSGVAKWGTIGIVDVSTTPDGGDLIFTMADGSTHQVELNFAALGVDYNDTQTQLDASNVQVAIEKIYQKLANTVKRQVTDNAYTTTIENTGVDMTINFTENGLVDRSVFIDKDGFEFIDNGAGEDFRPKINQNEQMAYLSDLEGIEPTIDNQSITKNLDNQLQAVGLMVPKDASKLTSLENTTWVINEVPVKKTSGVFSFPVTGMCNYFTGSEITETDMLGVSFGQGSSVVMLACSMGETRYRAGNWCSKDYTASDWLIPQNPDDILKLRTFTINTLPSTTTNYSELLEWLKENAILVGYDLLSGTAIKEKTDIIETDGDGDKYLSNDGTYKEVQSAPEIDELSITLNSQDKLQTVAVIDQKTSNPNKQWTGTKAEYDAIEVKDPNTYYYITDDTDIPGMQNPMTSVNDLIIGGENGTPTRLPVGTEGQVLKVGTNGLEYGDVGGGSKLYQHNIYIKKKSTIDPYKVYINFITTNSNTMTFADVASYIYNSGFRNTNRAITPSAPGIKITQDTAIRIIYAIYTPSSTSIYAQYTKFYNQSTLNADNTITNEMICIDDWDTFSQSSSDVVDTVVEL